jgi:hypothetical protein
MNIFFLRENAKSLSLLPLQKSQKRETNDGGFWGKITVVASCDLLTVDALTILEMAKRREKFATHMFTKQSALINILTDRRDVKRIRRKLEHVFICMK